LIIFNDETDYDNFEIYEKLTILLAQHSSKDKSKAASNVIEAFGIIGFVKFLEGYYLILLTKRQQIAEIGGHYIYKIEDTTMIYIPNIAANNSVENRYLKTFQAVDLSSNFYFSYSYDLTNTLQTNMIRLNHKSISTKASTNTKKVEVNSDQLKEKEDTMSGLFSNDDLKKSWRSENGEECQTCGPFNQSFDEATEKRFLWNGFLQEELNKSKVNSIWKIDIIHGYAKQSCINLFGERIYMTLIGRRSSLFAGPRFHKRGCNSYGNVANEVETEQIVHRAAVTSLHNTPYTSYVQHRGSVPIHWSQDISQNVVPAKPPITINSDNSFSQATGKHFSQMFRRYGSPVTVLNLVKKRDKKSNEAALGNEFKLSIEHLNQFIRTNHQIKYHALDMAHLLRSTKVNVLEKLGNIAEGSMQLTGFFQSKPDLVLPGLRKSDPKWSKVGGKLVDGFRVQTGVLRTNCVDCLDRTNSAQFVASKCALAYQLYALGVIDKLELHFGTDAIRLFEEMFEEHGDIIALQYGGSLLVHTIQSYRRMATAWSSQSRDIVTTLSRYYSNTFSDTDKQSAINLFLGVFQPALHLPHLWDLTTDEYLHNDTDLPLHTSTKWWDSSSLPLPSSSVSPKRDDDVTSAQFHCKDCCDWFDSFHRCDQLTTFDDHFSIRIPRTVARSDSEDQNPFTIRKKEVGDTEHQSGSLRTQDDSGDSDSSFDFSDDSSLDSVLVKKINNNEISNPKRPKKPSLQDFSAKSMYGIDLKVDEEDINFYKQQLKCKNFKSNFKGLNEEELQIEPTVDDKSLRIYHDYVSLNFHADYQFYKNYLDENSNLY